MMSIYQGLWYDVMLVTSTVRRGKSLFRNAVEHTVTNRAGDVMKFSSNTWRETDSYRAMSCQTFLIKTETCVGKRKNSAKHAYIGLDIAPTPNGFASNGAVITLPMGHPIFDIPSDHFEHLTFFPTIGRQPSSDRFRHNWSVGCTAVDDHEAALIKLSI